MYDETKALTPPDSGYVETACSIISLEKIRRDAQNLKQHARFVFILKTRGVPEFIWNPSAYVANIIAVLGPASVAGQKVDEAVLLEIGLSRTRPYQQLERKILGGIRLDRRVVIKDRRCVRKLKKEEFVFLWPHLYKALASFVQSTRKEWSSKGPWRCASDKGVWEANRGARFSVSRDDRPLLRELLRHDRARRYEFLRDYAVRLAEYLQPYKYASYPAHQLKKLAGLQDAIEVWRRADLAPFERQYVILRMEEKKRALFREGLHVFKLKDPLDELPEKKTRLNGFHRLKGADIRVIRKGAVHGKNCVTFEFAFEAWYSRQHNV